VTAFELPTSGQGLPPFEGQQRERVRISLTPLIDVVFILLVFFMLASSYVEWGAINLMSGSDLASDTGNRPTLTLSLGPDGVLRDSAGVPLHEGERLLDAVMARLDGQRGPVVVAPGESVSLQTVVSALDTLTLAGVTPLSMAREESLEESATP